MVGTSSQQAGRIQDIEDKNQFSTVITHLLLFVIHIPQINNVHALVCIGGFPQKRIKHFFYLCFA